MHEAMAVTLCTFFIFCSMCVAWARIIATRAQDHGPNRWLLPGKNRAIRREGPQAGQLLNIYQCGFAHNFRSGA
jgi:hypothetical protein